MVVNGWPQSWCISYPFPIPIPIPWPGPYLAWLYSISRLDASGVPGSKQAKTEAKTLGIQQQQQQALKRGKIWLQNLDSFRRSIRGGGGPDINYQLVFVCAVRCSVFPAPTRSHRCGACVAVVLRFPTITYPWAATTHVERPDTYEDFDAFVVAVKQAFGVEANNITALRRKALDDLRWGTDVPVFFAEFDRLTTQLGITGHDTKIAMVESKLPVSLKETLATQALSFANYETMRERCGHCGKMGHRAADCKAKN
ncbi:hypothetical protein F5883DRAFT_239500 [Diaporthe sp. PMI_573]|nr:hypothetical protein F5883DRAFT_239500 [Diaporthaceae sp. PMI_573]